MRPSGQDLFWWLHNGAPKKCLRVKTETRLVLILLFLFALNKLPEKLKEITNFALHFVLISVISLL
jgi:hypothetical protein